MAIAKNIENQVNAAVGRILLDARLELAPTQMKKIQDAVNDAAIQLFSKETGGAKGRYDLPRALDRFGQTVDAGAPEIEAPKPEEHPEEAVAARETAPEETPDAGEPFKPFDERTPAEQAAGEKGEAAPGAAEGAADAPEDEAAKGAEAKIPERGGITQGINALRFRKELKQIDQQLKELTKRRKVLTKDLQKKERLLAPFERRKRLLENSIRLLRMIKAICWAFGALLALFGIGEVIAAAALYLGRVIRVMKKQLLQIKNRVKPFEDRVKAAREKVIAVEKEARTIARRAIEIRNASLRERAAGTAPALAA